LKVGSKTMRNDRDMLLRLAANRRRRMDARGRPMFALTRAEAESSAHMAMR
jgi:hypothetical protein